MSQEDQLRRAVEAIVSQAPEPPPVESIERPRPGSGARGPAVAVAVFVVVVGSFLALQPLALRDAADGPGLRLNVATEQPEFAFLAIVHGQLEIDPASGCVWLSDGDLGRRSEIKWPVGTTARSDPPLVVLPDGTEALSGDFVTGGGGYVPSAPDGDCDGDGSIALLHGNLDGDILVESPDELAVRVTAEWVDLVLSGDLRSEASNFVDDLSGLAQHIYERRAALGRPEISIESGTPFGVHPVVCLELRYPGSTFETALVFNPAGIQHRPRSSMCGTFSTVTTIEEGVLENLERVPVTDGDTRGWAYASMVSADDAVLVPLYEDASGSDVIGYLDPDTGIISPVGGSDDTTTDTTLAESSDP